MIIVIGKYDFHRNQISYKTTYFPLLFYILCEPKEESKIFFIRVKLLESCINTYFVTWFKRMNQSFYHFYTKLDHYLSKRLCIALYGTIQTFWIKYIT
ncbi:hypothetical protein BLOT_001901 [Blomia tropicalis]|nr:hypothetical protein BLOT_001901 [Blomia tropicalis]